MNYKNIRKIIFVCKYNRVRSIFAEQYFKKINKNKKINAVSGGIFYYDRDIPVYKKIAKKHGIVLNKASKKILTLSDLLETDLIILVADDIPKKLFNYPSLKEKVIIWKIPDEFYKNEKNIDSLMRAIKRKVEKLNKKLGSKN